MLSNRPNVLVLAFEDVLKPSGGMGVHIYEVCKRLAKDFRITVVCVDADHHGSLWKVEKTDSGTIEERRTKENWWHLPNESFRVLKISDTNDYLSPKRDISSLFFVHDSYRDNIFYYLKNSKFDLIHLHDAPLWRVAKQLRILWDVPILMTCHLSPILSSIQLGGIPNTFDLQNEGTALGECNKIITVSQEYKNKLTREVGVPDEKITVIPNGVDSKFLSTIPFDESTKQRFGEKMVVFVGRFVPSKGIEIIMDAIEACPNHFFVLIAGLAPTVENIDPLAKRLKGLQQTRKNFIWYNIISQEKKWKLMKMADLAIMPSLHEPFGIVALEWFALRVPLIVSRTGGLAEFCNSDNCTLIDPSTASLIAAIYSHSRNETKLEKGFLTAKYFNWKAAVEETSKVYSNIINIGD